MNRERHERIQRIFEVCSEVPAEDQASRLAELCGDDDDLRASVARLLDLDANLHSRIRPVEIRPRELSGALPDRIGDFRILRRLGVGGMGIVYLAEQEKPRRAVALKVLRSDLFSEEARQRFAREAELLGKLQHPGIAAIHQAGTTDDGQLYFAMEFVEGISLTEYASQQRLGTRDALALIARVCDAVEHAHRSGVLHRDLKPGNILVGGDGAPRILDFGIARGMHADVQTLSLRTDVGQLMGTVPYMSPEQVGGTSNELDGRSDVYALGVIAFELLAGIHPIDVSGLPLLESTRLIREEEPRRLSSVNPVLRGDVETIVAKALEKEPGRRYASAADLASDIRRYLADQPIVARPASVGYQLGKFARRNRALVGGVAATFAAVVIGLVVSIVLYLDAASARRAEHAEADRANAINSFLLDDLLAAPDPWSERGRDVTVAEVVEGAEERLEGRFPGQPRVEAGVRRTLAATYASLGRYAEAVVQHQVASGLEGGDGREPSVAFARDLDAWSGALRQNGQFEEAREKIDRAVAMLEDLDRTDGVEYAHALRTRAALETAQGEYTTAETSFAAALQALERTAPDDRESIASLLGDWGSLLHAATREPEALQKKREALAILRDVHGADSPQVGVTLGDIAGIHVKMDSIDVALDEYARARQILGNTLGETHPKTLEFAVPMGEALRRAERPEEAEALLQQTWELTRDRLGPEHPQTLQALNGLALHYLYVQKDARAYPLYIQLVDAAERVLGPEHDETLRYRTNLAWTERKVGDVRRAMQLFRENFDAYQRVYGIDNLNTLVAGHGLAIALADGGELDEAIDVYRQIVGGCRDLRTECGYRWGRYLFELGKLLMRTGQYPDAASTLREGWDACVETWGEEDWRSSQIEFELGQALALSGDPEGAEHLLASYGRLRTSDRVSPTYKQDIYVRLGDGLAAAGQTGQMDGVEAP